MIRSVIKTTLPILFGFLPLGIAFGILFQELGYPWYFATLMGICVYAGAAQFMAVGMLGAGVGLFEIAISTFFLNSIQFHCSITHHVDINTVSFHSK